MINSKEIKRKNLKNSMLIQLVLLLNSTLIFMIDKVPNWPTWVINSFVFRFVCHSLNRLVQRGFGVFVIKRTRVFKRTANTIPQRKELTIITIKVIMMIYFQEENVNEKALMFNIMIMKYLCGEPSHLWLAWGIPTLCSLRHESTQSKC